MSVIVKSTPEAIDAVTRMRAVIDHGLMDQLTLLNKEGEVLNNRQYWSGPKADEFGGRWHDMSGMLTSMIRELTLLNDDLKAVQAAIQAAGGA